MKQLCINLFILWIVWYVYTIGLTMILQPDIVETYLSYISIAKEVLYNSK